MMNEPAGDCTRCGKCCFYPTGDKAPDGGAVLRACRNLVDVGGGRYHCRAYSSRLGLHIGTNAATGKKFYCTMYDSLNREIVGCPLNVGGKRLYDVKIVKRKEAVQYDFKGASNSQQDGEHSEPVGDGGNQ